MNTIGRSDSIDDLMLSYMDFENDSLTVDAIDAFISRQLFDYSYPLLLQKLYNVTPMRSADANINTIANRLYLLVDDKEYIYNIYAIIN